MGTDRWQRNSHSRSLRKPLKTAQLLIQLHRLTWFFVIVVDNVDVVVIDADVPMLEISLLVIVRLDCLSSTHHSFPEARYMFTITSKMIAMMRKKLMKMRTGFGFRTKSFPKSRQRSSWRKRDRSFQLPPDQILLQNFPKMMNWEIFFFSPASMESLEAGKKPMLDNHPMF